MPPGTGHPPGLPGPPEPLPDAARSPAPAASAGRPPSYSSSASVPPSRPPPGPALPHGRQGGPECLYVHCGTPAPRNWYTDRTRSEVARRHRSSPPHRVRPAAPAGTRGGFLISSGGCSVRRRSVSRWCGVAFSVIVAVGLSACTTSAATPDPNLAARGTTMTTVKPTRQDLDNSVSLSGKVSLNPVFGIVASVAGQVRYLDVSAATGTPTKPTKAGNVYVGGKATAIDVPAGATFAGRLVDDRSTVAVGTPIVSAKYVGYGIAADIVAADAYRISDALALTVQAQILINVARSPAPCWARSRRCRPDRPRSPRSRCCRRWDSAARPETRGRPSRRAPPDLPADRGRCRPAVPRCAEHGAGERAGSIEDLRLHRRGERVGDAVGVGRHDVGRDAVADVLGRRDRRAHRHRRPVVDQPPGEDDPAGTSTAVALLPT